MPQPGNSSDKSARQPRMIRRRDFLALLGAGTLVGQASSLYCGTAGPRRPNIIVILSDDHGYAEVGYQGCKDVPTPNIDSIAGNGVQFTDGHVSCPVCSPTRAGLVTGRYQHRFGHEFNPGPPTTANEDFGLPLSQITIADLVKEAGYTTGMVGKWHLGLKPQFHPMKRGFQEYFGFLHGAHDYFNAKADSNNPILRGTEAVDEKEYLTDAFSREAVAFIERHRKEPFFLYVTPNAIHSPMQAPQKYLDRFANIVDTKRRTFAAQLSALDDLVGAALRKLRDSGIEEDTLIFFLGDNGGPTPSTTSNNTPLRGFKSQLLEGGHRVPFALQWKRRIPGGQVYRQMVSSLDILPTVVAAAGGTLPKDRPMDGVDLVPYLTGEKKTPPHEFLFWRQADRHAVRMGEWKLLVDGSQPQLFDLSKDIGENKDLAQQQPDKVKEMSQAFDRWNAEMIAPLWKTAARGGQQALKQGKNRVRKP